MRTSYRPYGVILVFFLAAGAAADIYRCPGEDGEPSYSQFPCTGAGTRVLLHRETAVTGGGLRAGEQQWLAARARDKRAAKRAAKAGGRAGARSGPGSAANKQAYRCKSKRRHLDAVRAELRRGYKPARGERLRRRRAEYEDYLASFCD